MGFHGLRLIPEIVEVNEFNTDVRQVGTGVHILHHTAADFDGHSGRGQLHMLLIIDAVMFLDRDRSFFDTLAVLPVDAVGRIAFEMLGLTQIVHLLVFEMKKGRFPASQTLPRRAIYIKKRPKVQIPLDAL